MEYRNSFENYAYLWVDDRQEFLRQFLLYHQLTAVTLLYSPVQEGVSAVGEEPSEWSKGQQIKQVCVVSLRHVGYYECDCCM